MKDEEVRPLVLELVELGSQCGPGTKVASLDSTKEEISANLQALFDEYRKREESEEDYFNWEEWDYCKYRAFYDSELEDLEDIPTREKIRRKNVKATD